MASVVERLACLSSSEKNLDPLNPFFSWSAHPSTIFILNPSSLNEKRFEDLFSEMIPRFLCGCEGRQSLWGHSMRGACRCFAEHGSMIDRRFDFLFSYLLCVVSCVKIFKS